MSELSILLEFIEDPSKLIGSSLPEDMYIKLVEINASLIEFVPQTESICLAAIKKAGVLDLIRTENITQKLCDAAIEYHALSIQDVPENMQTNEMCWKVIRHDSSLIEFIINPTDAMWEYAVKDDPTNIQFMENQKYALCLYAVKENWKALEFINDQTEELCLEAVKQHHNALSLIRKQTEKICIEAVKYHQLSLIFVNVEFRDKCLKYLENTLPKSELAKLLGYCLYVVDHYKKNYVNVNKK